MALMAKSSQQATLEMELLQSQIGFCLPELQSPSESTVSSPKSSSGSRRQRSACGLLTALLKESPREHAEQHGHSEEDGCSTSEEGDEEMQHEEQYCGYNRGIPIPPTRQSYVLHMAKAMQQAECRLMLQLNHQYQEQLRARHAANRSQNA